MAETGPLQDTVALRRYLQRHIAPGLPGAPPEAANRWLHCLVIPAYDESPSLLNRLRQLTDTAGKILVILVLNRPDSDTRTDSNSALRSAIYSLPDAPVDPTMHRALVSLAAGVDLFLYDLEQSMGSCPASQGVGLARKYGCDIALKWMQQGAIQSNWLCSTDADAQLPGDYFQRIDSLPASAVAASLPFSHRPGNDHACNAATALYELRLHHYVLGLEYAGSPYAYHTLGSTLAVRAESYTAVRGFPRRAGGEDFYLLNKLAKVGAIARPGGDCIELDSRPSHRVPFGTGPAVSGIADSNRPEQLPLFYHPMCFHALRCLLNAIPRLSQQDNQTLVELLQAQALDDPIIEVVASIMYNLGLEAALAHCYKQSRTEDQFQRQFHQWFDGFRSLKFIHAMRDAGWPDQTLLALDTLQPMLWPAGTEAVTGVESLRKAVCNHLGWRISNRRG